MKTEFIPFICLIAMLVSCSGKDGGNRSKSEDSTRTVEKENYSKKVYELIQIMKTEYPGAEFEKSGFSLVKLTEDLNDSDLNLIVQGYLDIIKGDYKNYGNYKITLGYYFMAHDQFRYILKYHQKRIIPILHFYLLNSEVEIANGASFLLGVFGDDSSIPHIRKAKMKFQSDTTFNIFADGAISILSPAKNFAIADYRTLTLNQRLEMFLVHNILFQALLNASSRVPFGDNKQEKEKSLDTATVKVKAYYHLTQFDLTNILAEGLRKKME